MNVSMPTLSTSNTSTVKASAGEAVSESGEGKGFFETLSDVISGEEATTEESQAASGKESAGKVEADTASEAGEGSDSEISSEKSAESKAKVDSSDESTDELLKSSDGETKAQLSEDDESSTTAKSSEASAQASDSVASASAAKGKEVEQTMDEGQELLGRLDQANKTLQPESAQQAANGKVVEESGNGLPQAAAVSSAATGQQIQSEGITKPTNSASQPSSEAVGVGQTQSQKIQWQESGESVVTEQTSSKGADVVAAGGAAALTQVSAEQTAGNQSIASAEAIVADELAVQGAASKTNAASAEQMLAQQGATATVAAESIVPESVAVAGATQIQWDSEPQVTEQQRVPVDTLIRIDTKLMTEEPLTPQEQQVVEGLKSGELIADIPYEQAIQLGRLNQEVKLTTQAENAAQVKTAQTATAAAVSQQFAAAEAKAASLANTPMAATTSADKAAAMMSPELMSNAAAFNPAAASAGSASPKAMQAALGGISAQALKGSSNTKGESTEPTNLAGQIQAAAGQQGATSAQTPAQQARLDAAQQAQVPLQLTKEMANEQVQEKVQMMMSKNLKNLDIRLDPPELGRMQIRMTTNNDIANVHFTVTNPQAREIIEQTLPRLREMLAQQGMQLADSSVQQQSAGQQQGGYANADERGQGGSGRGNSGQSDENFDADVNLDLNVASKRDGISFYA